MATAQKYNLLSFNQTLELILMPNEDCNFRCVYCYEDFVKSEMKETVQKGILKYLEKTYSLIIGPLIGSTLIISIGFTGVFFVLYGNASHFFIAYRLRYWERLRPHCAKRLFVPGL